MNPPMSDTSGASAFGMTTFCREQCPPPRVMPAAARRSSVGAMARKGGPSDEDNDVPPASVCSV